MKSIICTADHNLYLGWNFCQRDQFNSQCQDRNIVSLPADLGPLFFSKLGLLLQLNSIKCVNRAKYTHYSITAVTERNTEDFFQSRLYITQAWKYNYTTPLAHGLVSKSLAITFNSYFAVFHTAGSKKF